MPIQINPAPTFSSVVNFVELDGDEGQIAFTFRHKTQQQLAEWREDIDSRPLAESLREVVVDWGEDVLADDGKPIPYSPDALRQFIEAYQPRGHFLAVGYLRALTEARVKNSARSPAV